MKKKLIEFLPPEIANIEDFKEIMNAETIELEVVENKQRQLFHENFIDTATEYGIKHQEKLFKVRPDLENETLEFRKLRIKNRKIDKAPFTHRFLEHKLESLFGKDNYKLDVLNDKYILKVDINTFDWNMFNEIINNFRKIIPCDMILNSTLTNKIETNVYVVGTTICGEELTVYPWSPKNIESKGNVTVAIGNNTGFEDITIYPRKED
ncbi:putative phage tail protein [Clostridium sp. K25]|uniref:putative phage tail protein n=1 Tax=Clostridium sp. K25 TaxID=1443109 RepID=UPI0004D41120|nr:putative phage tail protein [Clostridium sp. K25]KEI06171.1 putative phage protein [Clostridium sp. K25]